MKTQKTDTHRAGITLGESESGKEGKRRGQTLKIIYSWMNAAGTDGSLSGKALKSEAAASESFFLSGGDKMLVDSTFFILWYFLKEAPACNIFFFSLILGIPLSGVHKVVCVRQ